MTSASRLPNKVRPNKVRELIGSTSAIGLVCLFQANPLYAAPMQEAAAPEAATASPRLNPTGRDVVMSSPLRDGGFILAEVQFTLGADDTLSVDTQSLLAALKPVLAPDRHAALEGLAAGQSSIPASHLAPTGIRLTYDPATIGLLVDIPADARMRQTLSLRNFRDQFADYAQPARVSGYVNFRTYTDYVWSGSDTGMRAPMALVDSAFRIRGLVLENEGTLDFSSDASRLFSREGSRLVYDDRDHLIRFTAGDLQPVGRGFSGTTPMSGFSASRVYSIVDPMRLVQPSGNRSFTLSRSSTVETRINGQSVRRVRLDPGTYSVNDFPFLQGTNDVQFVIEDDGGGRETISFRQSFDRTLLAPGLTEFAVHAGVASPLIDGARDYQFDEAVASGWFRRGIGDTLTLGGNFQYRDSGQVLGIEAVFATPLGTIGGDTAFSRNDTLGDGYAFNIGLDKTFGGYGGKARAVSVTAEYRSENFTTPASTVYISPIAWTLSASYSQGIGDRQYVSLTGTWQTLRGGRHDEVSTRLTYGYAITPRISLTVDGTYQRRNELGTEYGVRANLLIRIGRRSAATAEFDSQGSRSRVGFQTAGGEGVGSWTASADLEGSPDGVGGNGSFNYIANRVEAGLSHTTTYDFDTNGIESQRSSLRLGTALVFADGHIAVSRPIYDSFLMVAPHKTLEGADAYIDPREGHYTAKSGTLGGAVDPTMPAYIPRLATYDVPEAPVGYDLGAASVRVKPPYRGGYLVVAGSDYSVTALGTLLQSDGRPVELLAGKAIELDGDKPRTLTVFTNRTGRFGISGLRPGRWKIEMPQGGSAIIEIPKGEKGVARLGDVKLGE